MKFLLLLTLLMSSSIGLASRPVVLVLGDSLSAAYGIEQSAGWVNLLRTRLASQPYPYEVVNASISGDTTAGGLARLPRALADNQPRLLIIELGANDGLRGLDLQATRHNLARMIELGQANGGRVLLIGMRLPPNFGKAFSERFHTLFRELAADKAIGLVPFLLDGVALRPELMQGDGLHPNAAAQPLILENVWPHLERLL